MLLAPGLAADLRVLLALALLIDHGRRVEEACLQHSPADTGTLMEIGVEIVAEPRTNTIRQLLAEALTEGMRQA